MSANELLFEILTPVGFFVRSTHNYWAMIVKAKHPVMSGQENLVKRTLEKPDEIRRSRNDANVYLFYKLTNPKRWTCAVAKRLNGDGFLITTYPTDAIKEGERIWTR